MRSSHRLCAVVALGLLGSLASAQEPAKAPAAAPETAGLKVGPATIAPHWSKNAYPTSVPEGAIYYIVERGDTLWDISKRFLANPYLWPQIWDQNKYVTDAHWIYPGDPLILPKVALVSDKAGESGPGTGEEEGGQGGAEGAETAETGPKLSPITEEATLQCADYIIERPRGREPADHRLRRGRRQGRVRRSRHPLPQQGQQRGHQGR